MPAMCTVTLEAWQCADPPREVVSISTKVSKLATFNCVNPNWSDACVTDFLCSSYQKKKKRKKKKEKDGAVTTTESATSPSASEKEGEKDGEGKVSSFDVIYGFWLTWNIWVCVVVSVRPAGRVSVCGTNFNIAIFFGRYKYDKHQTLHDGSIH